MSKVKTKEIPKLRFPGFTDKWAAYKLGDLSTKVGSGSTPRGGSTVYKKSGVPFVRSQNVVGGQLKMDDVAYIDEQTHRSMSNSAIKPDDVLLNITGASLGRTCVVPNNFIEGNLNQHVCIIRLNKSANPYLIHTLLSTKKGLYELLKTQTGGGKEGLNFQAVRLFRVNLPNHDEQKRIAEFLTLVDENTQGFQKKVELLEKYKKGAMQAIFAQKIRFKDENGKNYPDWEEKKLGDFIADHKESSRLQDEYPVMTSSRKGVVLQKDYYGASNRITDRENIGYNILPPNYLTYRSRSDDGVFRFNLNTIQTTGIVSYFYPVFSIKNGSGKFFEEYLNANWKILYKYSVGTSQKVLAHTELKKIKVPIPNAQEQQKIADFLTAIDDKINLTKKELEQAKTFKKALLQRMFV